MSVGADSVYTCVENVQYRNVISYPKMLAFSHVTEHGMLKPAKVTGFYATVILLNEFAIIIHTSLINIVRCVFFLVRIKVRLYVRVM